MSAHKTASFSMTPLITLFFALVALTVTGCGSSVDRGFLTADGACNNAPFAGTLDSNGDPVGFCGDTTTVNVTDSAGNEGTVTVDIFRGIQYATTSQRWAEPQVSLWPGTLHTDNEWGAICPQSLSANQSDPPGGMDENCQFLNVWSPEVGGTEELPVMVFIHGGAFLAGAGSPTNSGTLAADPPYLYDGSSLAANGKVVLVTLNYRLGALGFLYANQLPDGSPLSLPSNLGLKDQQKALSWIQDNIHYFNGDPDQVTIFGESAGAMSVGLHLFSVPSSHPPRSMFRGVIMESNPLNVLYKDTVQYPDDAATWGNQLVADLCATAPSPCTVETLTNLSLEQVIQSQASDLVDPHLAGKSLFENSIAGALDLAPVLDEEFVVAQPSAGFASDVEQIYKNAGTTPPSVLFGVNKNEGVLFEALSTEKADPLAVYGVLMADSFSPGDILKINGYYHPKDDASSALASVISDYAFGCGNLAAINSALGQGQFPEMKVFGYIFAQPPMFDLYKDSNNNPLQVCSQTSGNVCHGNELPFVFGTLSKVNDSNTDDQTLSGMMQDTWTCFASAPDTFSTSCNQKWTWPADFDQTKLVVLAEPANSTDADLERSSNCSLWSGITPKPPQP